MRWRECIRGDWRRGGRDGQSDGDSRDVCDGGFGCGRLGVVWTDTAEFPLGVPQPVHRNGRGNDLSG